MNNPSPLVPQGTSPEPRRRSHLTAVFIILFIHVGALALLLLQGCSKSESPAATDAGNAPVLTADTPPPALPVVDANPPGLTALPPPGVPSGATPAGAAGGLTPLPPAGGALPPPPGGLPNGLGGGAVPPPSPFTPPPSPPAGLDPVSSTPSTEHTVMRGETGSVIAKKYGMGWKAIEAANPGVDARKLKIGQKLNIPAKSISPAPSGGAVADGGAAPAHSAEGSSASSYTVKSGDTLAKVARSHGVTVKALKAANGLKLDAIKVGQKLKVPGKAPAAPKPSEPVIPAPAPALPLPVPAPAPTDLPPPGLLPPPARP